MEYTKGNWMLSEDGMTVETAHAPNGHVIAMMNGIGNKVQADARLISLAPKMYEALKAIVDAYDKLSPIQPSELAHAIGGLGREALAKAERK